jgi:hypothetical protein
MKDLFGNEIKEDNGAAFSECGKYRYALWRIWNPELPFVMFIGLNPSTANQVDDDPTIRRVKRFAKDWGYGGVYMMNCFPFVTAYPKELVFGITEETTFRNYTWLINMSLRCSETIFAWGNFKELGKKDTAPIIELFPKAKALQLNANGSPKHPLYVKADIKPILFKALNTESNEQ